MIELSISELDCLIDMHKSCAEYALACKQTQIKIANTSPLHKFGKLQTKTDWIESAAAHDNRRKFHRGRAWYFIKIKQSKRRNDDNNVTS